MAEHLIRVRDLRWSSCHVRLCTLCTPRASSKRFALVLRDLCHLQEVKHFGYSGNAISDKTSEIRQIVQRIVLETGSAVFDAFLQMAEHLLLVRDLRWSASRKQANSKICERIRRMWSALRWQTAKWALVYRKCSTKWQGTVHHDDVKEGKQLGQAGAHVKMEPRCGH